MLGSEGIIRICSADITAESSSLMVSIITRSKWQKLTTWYCLALEAQASVDKNPELGFEPKDNLLSK